MTKTKSTKHALIMSVMALFLCFTMLLGTTFAWFTDSAVSGNNIIKTGNLDMKLSWRPYGADHAEEWAEVTESTVLFGKDALYEPGYTEAVWLKVENLGSLAFRYDLAINVASEKQGTNKAGEKFSLSDYLDVKYMTTTSTDMESNFYTTRESLDSFNFGGVANSGVASLSDDIAVIKNGVAFSSTDATNGAYSSAYVLVVISMPTTVGNEANHNGTDIPQIDFTLTALATQLSYEDDSFGNDYDKDAEYKEPATPVATFAELKEVFEKGGSVELTADIAITELVTIPAGVEVYLDMNGKTITPASADVDPLFDVKTGAALVIDGNGTFDLGEIGTVKGMSLMYPRGDVTINSGTFKIATNGTKYGSMFVGISGGQGKLIINGGYFDGGYYKEGDCFNNCRNLINGSWGQYIRIYGGTFVGQNPAWGDEGMAFLCPHCTHTPGQGYCQALFLEGQSREDTELPEGYTITEGTTADGRPTYTVNYSK